MVKETMLLLYIGKRAWRRFDFICLGSIQHTIERFGKSYAFGEKDQAPSNPPD